LAIDTEDLRAIQAPIKERYGTQPDTALITLKAEGRLGEGTGGSALSTCTALPQMAFWRRLARR